MMKKTNEEAWSYAVSLVRASGLEPTREFLEMIEQEKRGELSMGEIKVFLDKKYKKEIQENQVD